LVISTSFITISSYFECSNKLVKTETKDAKTIVPKAQTKNKMAQLRVT